MTSTENDVPLVGAGAVTNGVSPGLQYCTVTFPGVLTEPWIWKIRLLLLSIVAVTFCINDAWQLVKGSSKIVMTTKINKMGWNLLLNEMRFTSSSR